MKASILATLALTLILGSAHADDPASSPLAAGRRLVPPPPNPGSSPEDAELIDHAALERLAREGRIAAVTTGTTADPDTLDGGGSPPGRNRSQWRKDYRAQRAAVEKLESRLASCRERLRSLDEAWGSCGSDLKRLEVEEQMDLEAERERELASAVRQARAQLQAIARRAREDGATAEWFRDLR